LVGPSNVCGVFRRCLFLPLAFVPLGIR